MGVVLRGTPSPPPTPTPHLIPEIKTIITIFDFEFSAKKHGVMAPSIKSCINAQTASLSPTDVCVRVVNIVTVLFIPFKIIELTHHLVIVLASMLEHSDMILTTFYFSSLLLINTKPPVCTCTCVRA